MLAPMRYKSYIWPHNPTVYSIRYQREVALHKVPLGGYHMQDMGLTCRVMEGEGEFVGEDAYDQFRALASVFYDPGPGTLLHPLWQAAQTYFVNLSLRQEPTAQFVAYSFTFWEDTKQYDTETGTTLASGASTQGATSTPTGTENSAPLRYIVRQGDTLWHIASSHQVELAALVAANPQIKNPNLIFPGQEVYIP